MKIPMRIVSSAALAAILLAGLPRARGDSARPAAETILFGGKILTVDRSFRVVEALAIAGGKILALGSNDEIRKLATPATRMTDLRGRTVIPGLADNHLHSAGGGPGVDLSRVRSLGELLDAVAARARQAKPGEVIVSNSDWHEAQLKEQRLPLRQDLDKAAPDTPVVLIRGGHEFILNTAALKKWGITRDTPDPSGGSITRDASGEPNGELVDAAKSLARLDPPPPKDLETRIREQQDEYHKLNAAGLTSVRHPGAPIEQYRLLQEMERRGLLTMRVNFLVALFGAKDVETVKRAVASWGVSSDEGDPWLRIGGAKLGVDGGFEGGRMTEPYAEPYGKGGTYRGLQLVSQDAYTAIVRELNQLGWRVATHAVGDAAMDQVLAGYEAADRDKSIAGRRWTIEHGFLPREDQFARINRLGVLVSAQDHLYLAGPSLRKYWGEKRANWVTPVRAYLDHHVAVSAGTDSPVVPFPPLWVIYHFVTRDTISGGVYGPDQRITRQEALRLSTINNAYLTFEEDVKGSLEPGKLADLVVLSGDLMTCPEKDILNLQVLLTMVNGQIVYQSGEFK
jgi:predicted amidohydrolase YtcJ